MQRPTQVPASQALRSGARATRGLAAMKHNDASPIRTVISAKEACDCSRKSSPAQSWAASCQRFIKENDRLQTITTPIRYHSGGISREFGADGIAVLGFDVMGTTS